MRRTVVLVSMLAILGCHDSRSSRPEEVRLPDGHFTANLGQIGNEEVLLYHSSGDIRFGFVPGGVLIHVVDDEGGVLVRERFVGSRAVRPEGRGRLPFPSHYLRGERRVTDVPSYEEVVYRDLYDGIDLVYRAADEGLKYEFHLRPGADPSDIHVRLEGTRGVRIDSGGSLVVRTDLGEFRDSAPVSFSGEDVVPSRYVLDGPSSFRVAVEGWDGRTTLVIDPLVYSSFVGGKRGDYVRAMDTDKDGMAYLGGWTTSEDFPVTGGGVYQKKYTGTRDIFIVKIDPAQKVPVFATYVGGSDEDDCYAIRVDSRGRIYFAGQTKSLDFPVTDGSSHGGDAFDAYVARIEDTGDEIAYAGYVGGSGNDYGYALAVDDARCAYLGGYTFSADFPVTAGAFDTTYGGQQDGYILKVDTRNGTLVYATYIGGSSVDFLMGVAIDDAGSVFATGSTISSRDFPRTPGAFDVTYNGTQDAFVLKMTPDGAGLVYSGFLGGLRYERGFSIDVDGDGAAYVAGTTRSDNFPVTPGAFDEVYGDVDNGKPDGFVAKISPTGGAILYATYLGGGLEDEAFSIAVDADGEAHVTGVTFSADFPVTPEAHDESLGGESDAFVTILNASGTDLVESTYLGGSAFEKGTAIALGLVDGEFWISGETQSADFPLVGKSFDKKKGKALREGFVARFEP